MFESGGYDEEWMEWIMVCVMVVFDKKFVGLVGWVLCDECDMVLCVGCELGVICVDGGFCWF